MLNPTDDTLTCTPLAADETLQSSVAARSGATRAPASNRAAFAVVRTTDTPPPRVLVRDMDVPAPAGWRSAFGAALPDPTLRLRFHGPEGAPLVGVLGGISADRRVAAISGTRSDDAGWWPDMARPGGPIDTQRFCVVSMDYAPGAPEAPLSLTTADHAALFAAALEAAGVACLHALIGASFGGCVALAFAAAYPDRVERLCVISAAHRPHPMATAMRGVQRRILDFAERCDAREEGVALARQLAMISYRSAPEFAERFSPGLPADGDSSDVCGYLKARGAAFAGAMDAARYRTLSESLDRHAVDPAAITTPTLLIGTDTDQLAPIADMQALREGLTGPARLETLSCLWGHDSFLKDPIGFGAPLKALLEHASSAP